MKNFRLTYYQPKKKYGTTYKFMHDTELINFYKSSKDKLESFEIEWKNPDTDGYHKIMETKNGKKIYEAQNIPECFAIIK